MWQLNVYCSVLLVFNVLAIVCSNVGGTFHKCCPRDKSLMIIKENLNASAGYVCVNHERLMEDYGISSDPLYVNEGIEINTGVLDDCDALQLTPMDAADAPLMNAWNVCTDRLVAEVYNGTLKENIPKTVALTCNYTDVDEEDAPRLYMHRIRKCCPKGHKYDKQFHQCRKDLTDNNEALFEWSIQLNGNGIYVLDYGLTCKYNEFTVDLHESLYNFNINGSVLSASSKDGNSSGLVMPGEWCEDRDFNTNEITVQVCTKTCQNFGAFCVRKCCPPGHHYKLFQCGSFKSYCTPNEDDHVLYNITTYLTQIDDVHKGAFDVMGVGYELQCPGGKYGLNSSIRQDQHHLTSQGQLWTPSATTDKYCLEMFDRRGCSTNDVVPSAVLCFLPAINVKNFHFSAIVNTISSVCLALTLIVYCALPELKNLHGRTLICHVSMMLLACACLARVQYKPVQDSRFKCTLLGYTIYFGFVAAFAWLNVMCFDIWWTFGSVRNVKPLRKSGSERRRFLWYSFYAWGTTVVLTSTMYVLDRYPVSDMLDANIGNGVCWFAAVQNANSDWPHYIFFVLPMGVVTLTNFILWLLTARHCAKVKSEVHRLQAGSVGDRAKRRFRIDRAKYILTGKLWVVMGAGWVSELLSTVVTQPMWLWEIVDIFNELQGVFIFLILVVKPKLYYLIRKRLGLSRAPIDPRLEKPDARKNGTSSSGRTSSTFLSRTISAEEKAQMRTSLPHSIKRS